VSQPPAQADGDTLAAMQRWMQDALILPQLVDQDEVERRCTASENLPPAACLAIYQRGYILRLSKCLAEQFPALCYALGKELFDNFAREYLRVCPSDSYTLYELGRRFSDYLDNARPDRDLLPDQREGWIDFMVDLARYERLQFHLFDAPGHEGGIWPTTELADDRLVLQPCFELGVYRYPVAWYYHSIRERSDVPFPPQQESYVAVLRRDYVTSTFPINRVHYVFLKHLLQCRDVANALAHVSEVVDSPIEQVTRSWQEEVRRLWIDAGFFIERGAETSVGATHFTATE
jgi:hypothetical protein